MLIHPASCRLLWGQAGQSNALAIAEGLGFSRQIVADARKVRCRLLPAASLHTLPCPSPRSSRKAHVCAKLLGEWPRGLYIHPKPCVQVAAEMRVLTDAKARSESLAEQLGGQVEEAQVTSCLLYLLY